MPSQLLVESSTKKAPNTSLSRKNMHSFFFIQGDVVEEVKGDSRDICVTRKKEQSYHDRLESGTKVTYKE